MTRPPDKNAKTFQLIVQSKTVEEENKIKALKEICIRNGLKIKDEMFLLIDGWLRVHHWPETPGHSQFQLTEFPKTFRKDGCSFGNCNVKAEFVVFRNGNRVLLCARHFWAQPLKGRRLS